MKKIVPLISILLLGSSCGLNLMDNRGQPGPTKPTPPAQHLPAPNVQLITDCSATGENQRMYEFNYPKVGESSAFESPAKTFRVDLTRDENGVDISVWWRESEYQDYQKKEKLFHYASNARIQFGYARSVNISTSGTTQVDPWTVICE